MRENNQAAGKTWTYVYDDGGQFWHFIAGAVVGGFFGAISGKAGGGSVSDILISTVAGAANGLLAASGAGMITSMALSGAISGASSILSQAFAGDISLPEVIVDTVVGVVSGSITGAGASSVSSGAGGAKQMINAGKQSIKRITSALKTNGVSAAVTEGKKASRYYYKSTKRVTEQLFSLRNFQVNIGQAAYCWCKKMLKGGSN